MSLVHMLIEDIERVSDWEKARKEDTKRYLNKHDLTKKIPKQLKGGEGG